jgi:signal transduction histidine kinase
MMTRQPRTNTPQAGVLVRGVLAGLDRYPAWIRRHPPLLDAALAVALFWLTSPPVTQITGDHRTLVLALTPALLVPLVWRRRAPYAVFAVIFAAALAQLFVSSDLTHDVALLVAFYTVAANEPPRRVLAAAVALEVGAVLAALRYIKPGSSQVWSWVFASVVVAAAGLLGYYARTRRVHLASLVDRAERLERERDREARLAAAAERARITREMHDIVAHSIAVMIALADGAAYTAAESPDQAVTIMAQVSATGRSALAEMRRLLGVMRQPTAPEHTPQPTLADVDDLLTTVRAAGLSTRLAVTGRPAPLPPSAQLALYRIIQEALTNTLKHARATSAEVHLTYLPGEVGLEVTDDGKQRQDGQPGQPGTGSATGHGIIGMRERAAVFGGEVSAGPRAGGGWRVHTVLRPGPEGT